MIKWKLSALKYRRVRVPFEIYDDIDKNGILQPLTITHGGTVIDGHIRASAAKKLGIEDLPVQIAKYAYTRSEGKPHV